MKGKLYIWHNTNGIANQYFVCKSNRVLFQIPNWLGRLLTKGEQDD